jgi:hypothetical protein
VPRLTDEKLREKVALALLAKEKGLSVTGILSYSGLGSQAYYKYFPVDKLDYSIYEGKTIEEIMAMRKTPRPTTYNFCKRNNIKYKVMPPRRRGKGKPKVIVEKDLYNGQRYEDID